MEFGFSIGNGLSRIGFNLEGLRGKGTIVGCNRLHYDFFPDVLVTIDVAPMAEARKRRKEILNGDGTCWDHITRDETRQNILFNEEHLMSFQEVNGDMSNNSGIISCAYLAKILKVDRLYMIGFDFFRVHEREKHNDVYGKRVGRTRLHLCFNKLVAECPDTEFVRAGPIVDSDRDYFENVVKGIRYIESWKEFWDETSQIR